MTRIRIRGQTTENERSLKKSLRKRKKRQAAGGEIYRLWGSEDDRPIPL
jgi:hypothetical protein